MQVMRLDYLFVAAVMLGDAVRYTACSTQHGVVTLPTTEAEFVGLSVRLIMLILLPNLVTGGTDTYVIEIREQSVVAKMTGNTFIFSYKKIYCEVARCPKLV